MSRHGFDRKPNAPMVFKSWWSTVSTSGLCWQLTQLKPHRFQSFKSNYIRSHHIQSYHLQPCPTIFMTFLFNSIHSPSLSIRFYNSHLHPFWIANGSAGNPWPGCWFIKRDNSLTWGRYFVTRWCRLYKTSSVSIELYHAVSTWHSFGSKMIHTWSYR